MQILPEIRPQIDLLDAGVRDAYQLQPLPGHLDVKLALQRGLELGDLDEMRPG